MKVTINRRGHFNAAHKLYNNNWSIDKNYQIFGKCSNQNYHGHNYEFIVSVTGNINPITGFVISIDFLKKIIFTEIENKFDHKNFNLDIPEFKILNPTTENIAILIWNKINKKLPKYLSLKITLYETYNNFAEYTGKNE